MSSMLHQSLFHGVYSFDHCRWREWCGFPTVHSFGDLVGIMKNDTVATYSKIYKSVDDIDLWSAGISEKPLSGSMVGPTFACIIGKQFSNFRYVIFRACTVRDNTKMPLQMREKELKVKH